MAATNLKPHLPLIVIVGPTASGKTSLALDLAEKFHGEIICADSRTIYTGMDIGTAKPTLAEQARVPHWGLDLVEPNETYSVADFKQYATKKIEEIRGRGHIPFLVGGTGLYVDAVIFNYQFGAKADATLRTSLENMTIQQLHAHCKTHNVTLPENRLNKRYVIRAIERKDAKPSIKTTLIDQAIVVGIATDKELLRARISLRTEQLFDNGVVLEATKLGKKYGWNSQAMTGNIYPLINLYLKNESTLEEIKVKFTTLDWRLAKRQLTWLKRNPHITWLPLVEAGNYLAQLLANEQKS